MKEQKVFQNHRYCQLCLKISVNGVICVFVVHSGHQTHLELTSLTINIHVSTKTCVTGNNLVPHNALARLYPSSSRLVVTVSKIIEDLKI